METLLSDMRYAIVMMRRAKGFTAAALATLALGIGATTAVFSVVYGVLLRPLPYPEAERLVRLSEEHPGAVSPLRQPMLSNLTYHAWSTAPRTIDTLAAYRSSEYLVALPGGTVRMTGASVTPSLFGVIGASAALGRVFRPDEGRAGDDAYAVLSDRAWRQYFSADAAVVGRGYVIDGKPLPGHRRHGSRVLLPRSRNAHLDADVGPRTGARRGRRRARAHERHQRARAACHRVHGGAGWGGRNRRSPDDRAPDGC
jgi:hypothetical protein